MGETRPPPPASLLEDAREVLGSWSPEFLELRRRGEALTANAEQDAQVEGVEDVENVAVGADRLR